MNTALKGNPLEFFVKIWGTRGSIPTPGYATQRYGGNTTCVAIQIGDQLIICDAGTGIRELGLDIMKRNAGPVNGHWLFSHTHWDHIQGFPFFTPAYIPGNTFTVYGLNQGDQKAYSILSGQMSSAYFPVKFSDLGSNIVSNDLETCKGMFGDVKVSWFSQHHEGGSYAYSFEYNGLKFVFSTDNEVDLGFEDPEEIQGNLNKMRPVEPAYLDFIRDADLLIADGQYTEEEYPTKITWGHPRATTLVDASIQANVKKLAITHHDPMHTDRAVDEKIAACTDRLKRFRGDTQVFAAREGLELKLEP